MVYEADTSAKGRFRAILYEGPPIVRATECVRRLRLEGAISQPADFPAAKTLEFDYIHTQKVGPSKVTRCSVTEEQLVGIVTGEATWPRPAQATKEGFCRTFFGAGDYSRKPSNRVIADQLLAAFVVAAPEVAPPETFSPGAVSNFFLVCS